MPDVIREITDKEWGELGRIFEANGGKLPDKQWSTAMVCVDEQGLAGFWMLQTIYWAGPLWIREDRRKQGLWRKLHHALHSLFIHGAGTGYYSFSDSERMNHVFEQLGYTSPNVKVWTREV